KGKIRTAALAIAGKGDGLPIALPGGPSHDNPAKAIHRDAGGRISQGAEGGKYFSLIAERRIETAVLVIAGQGEIHIPDVLTLTDHDNLAVAVDGQVEGEILPGTDASQHRARPMKSWIERTGGGHRAVLKWFQVQKRTMLAALRLSTGDVLRRRELLGEPGPKTHETELRHLAMEAMNCAVTRHQKTLPAMSTPLISRIAEEVSNG